jgi:hypothetical protein
MANSTDDQLYELTAQINRLTKIFGNSGGESPYTSPGTSKPKIAGAAAQMSGGGLGGHLKTVTSLVKGMHGGVDDLLWSMKGATKAFAEVGIAAEVLIVLFEGAMKLTKTFSKMTDIGQNFGGSILNMAAQAGRSGLSLDQFSSLLMRNSTLTAMMNDTIIDSTTIQENYSKSTIDQSEAQAFQQKGMEAASSQTRTFTDHMDRARGAAGDMSDQHAASGDAASVLTQTLTGASIAAIALIRQQDQMGVSMADASRQMRALGQLTGEQAKAGASIAIMAHLSDAAKTASVMTTKQAVMQDDVSKMTQQLFNTAGMIGTSTADVAGTLRRSFAGAAFSASDVAHQQMSFGASLLRSIQDFAGLTPPITAVIAASTNLSAKQSESAALTAEYSKQISDANASMTQLAVSQGMLDGLTGMLTEGMTKSTQSAVQMAEKQQSSADLTTRFNAAVEKMSASAGQMAVEQSATSGTTTNLNEQLRAVTLNSSMIAGQQLGLSATTSDLIKQTTIAAGTVGTMAAKQGSIGDQTEQFAKQIAGATTTTGRISDRQRGIGDAVTILKKQFDDVTASTGNIIRTQGVSGSATDQYNKAMIEGQAVLAEMATRQNSAGEASASLTRQFKSATSIAADVTANQSATGAITTDLNRHINDASTTFSKMSTKQGDFTDVTTQIRQSLATASDALAGAKPGQGPDPSLRLRGSFKGLETTASELAEQQARMGVATATSEQKMTGFAGSTDRQQTATEAGIKSTTIADAATTSYAKSLTQTTTMTNEHAQAAMDANNRVAQSQQTANKTQRSTLAELQLTVRNDLEQFGFYGMALGELTNATSDYMETMRQGGLLYKLDNQERAHAVETMAADVTVMSAVFGKSREAIMKTTNDAMRQTNFAASMIGSDKSRAEAGQKWITFFASIPGQSGDKLASMFAEQSGRGGYIDTEMGKGFIDTGMGQLNAIFARANDALDKGIAPNAEMQASIMDDAYTLIKNNKQRLQQLTHDPAMRKQAQDQLDIAIAVQGKYLDAQGNFDRVKYAQSVRDAEINKGKQDILTKNMLIFSSTFEKITGGFMEGFYGALANIMGGGDDQHLKASLQMLHDIFLKLGSAIGTVLGIILSPTSISLLTLLFGYFSSWVKVIAMVVDASSAMLHGFKNIVDWIQTKLPSWLGGGPKKLEEPVKPPEKPPEVVRLGQNLPQHETTQTNGATVAQTTAMTKMGLTRQVHPDRTPQETVSPAKPVTPTQAFTQSPSVGSVPTPGANAPVSETQTVPGSSSGGLATTIEAVAPLALAWLIKRKFTGAGKAAVADASASVMRATGNVAGSVAEGTASAAAGVAAEAAPAVGGIAAKVAPIATQVIKPAGLIARFLPKLGLLKGVGMGLIGTIIGETVRAGSDKLFDGVLKGMPGHDTIQGIIDTSITGAEVGSTFGPLGALWGSIIGGVGGAVMNAIPSAEDAKKAAMASGNIPIGTGPTGGPNPDNPGQGQSQVGADLDRLDTMKRELVDKTVADKLTNNPFTMRQDDEQLRILEEIVYNLRQGNSLQAAGNDQAAVDRYIAQYSGS